MNQDEFNKALCEQEERHRKEIDRLNDIIKDLKAENKTFTKVMDSQSIAIDLFNNIIQNYIARDEREMMKRKQRRD